MFASCSSPPVATTAGQCSCLPGTGHDHSYPVLLEDKQEAVTDS
jgi:hypothetical protein